MCVCVCVCVCEKQGIQKMILVIVELFANVLLCSGLFY